jgi:3-oxoacyl-ACP reductase-like protein
VQFLAQYLSSQQLDRFELGVRLLAVAGLVKGVNAQLNKWALNNWKFSPDTQKWKWSREVAVITGGSSGIGLETVKQMLAQGIKVAVFDVQDVPKELHQCEYNRF